MELNMDEIKIQTHGFELNEKMRAHIEQRLYLVFGLKQYEVRKIIIKLSDEKKIKR